MRTIYYQVYNNGVGDIIEVPGTPTENDRRKGLPRFAVRLEQEVKNAKELEFLRQELINKHTSEKYPDVAIMLCYQE